MQKSLKFKCISDYICAKKVFRCCLFWIKTSTLDSIGINEKAMKSHKRHIDVHNWIYWICPVVQDTHIQILSDFAYTW